MDEIKSPASLRKKSIPLGPLRACVWSHYESGMMRDSNVNTRTAMERHEDGTVTLRITTTRGNRLESEEVYRVDKDTAEEVRALVEAEKLADWDELPYDPSKKPIMFDYSRSTSVILDFTSRQVSFDTDAAEQNGKGEVLGRLRDLLLRSKKLENLLSFDKRPPQTGMNGPLGQLGIVSGWTCALCGQRNNTGKFCPECGEPRIWTCKACGQTGNEGKYCTECGEKRT